jgi:kynureninase
LKGKNMKSMKTNLAIALLILGVGCGPQTNPAVSVKPASLATAQPASSAPMVAVVTKADWCSICNANGARVVELLGAHAQKGDFEIVVNDITSEATASSSGAALKKKGLQEAATGGAPGTIAFINSKTRERIGGATVAHQNAEINALIEAAQKRLGL